jgi:hypothetical protein
VQTNPYNTDEEQQRGVGVISIGTERLILKLFNDAASIS